MDMRDHFKSDWHIYNINRYLCDKCPLDYELFKALQEEKECFTQHNNNNNHIIMDDNNSSLKYTTVSLLSNNNNHEKNESSNIVTNSSLTASSHKHMLFFRNKNSEIIGINRCVLFTRKTMPVTMDELLACVSRVRQSRRWAILLYSGGKFAGGIFDGMNEVAHKTLQHYTVRAKQGGGQSSYDSLCGGLRGSKSAGANLRRHGETAIRNEISDLLHNKWRTLLQSCQLIFLWSPKVNRSIFFNPPTSSSSYSGVYNQDVSNNYLSVTTDSQVSSNSLPDPLAIEACNARLGMTIDDLRLRRIPCRSKHITYTHVKELYKDLSTFDVYDPDANLDFLSKSGRNQWRKLSESGDETLLETKSGRLIYGPLSLLSSSSGSIKKSVLSSSSDTSDLSDCASSHDNEEDEEEEEEEEEIKSLKNDYQKNNQIVISNKINKLPSSSSCSVNNENNTIKEIIDNFEDLYLTHQNWHRRVRVAIASEIGHNSNNIPSPECNSSGSTLPSRDVCLKLINHPLSDGRTLLHVAVELQSDPELLRVLLEYGCDPAVRLIPTPIDPSKEAEKVKRERERAKQQKQRQKEKRAAERALAEEKEKEAAEQARFLALSDREKRALAAERRLNSARAAAGEPLIVFSRCFQCGCDITGKVPFTYMDFNFCTPNCLKQHRLSASNSSNSTTGKH
ncbi:unnamed protein product [Heterobilharzia americana]|nr:unnamed protein product [Heterobilharzia americana]